MENGSLYLNHFMPGYYKFFKHPLSVVILSGLLACDARQDVAPVDRSLVAQPATPHIVSIHEGLEHPWSLAFLPDGSMLVTERAGRLRRVEVSESGPSQIVSGLPSIHTGGQAGLFDVVLDPNFAGNRTLYLSYAERRGNVNGLAVARARLSDDSGSLENVSIIFRQHPKRKGDFQYGGRMAFGHDGMLFVTLGDRNDWRHDAQKPGSHIGKVVRITTDGKSPPDNPFIGRRAFKPEIWSLGHRNPQGAAIHPQSGELWTHEHGPLGGDALNITRPGRNYGWPKISYGCDYGQPEDCLPVGGNSIAEGLEQPVKYWAPRSIAPSGLAFYNGERFPEWKGSLFIGALSGRALWRLVFDVDTIVEQERLFDELQERIRDIQEGPDGWLYLLTDDPLGRILRIER